MERLFRPSGGFAVIDLETTGFDTLRDRIVEVAVVQTDGYRIENRWSSLVNPGISIPAISAAFHGITDLDVCDAPELWALLPEIEDLCAGRTLVAHHATFDRNFLWTIRGPWICTLELSRKAYPLAPSYRLGRLVDYLGIRPQLTSEGQHRALPDAEAAAYLLMHCLESLKAA